MNIIKALGQLFVIQRVDEVLTGNSYTVTAYAEHITYTLNDRWIFPPVTIAGHTGTTLMQSILSQSTDMGGDWQTNYTFDVSSDIEAPSDFQDWYEMPDGVTPYEMLLG
jgi:phage-related protein